MKNIAPKLLASVISVMTLIGLFGVIVGTAASVHVVLGILSDESTEE